jgi:hypothetical protein
MIGTVTAVSPGALVAVSSASTPASPAASPAYSRTAA